MKAIFMKLKISNYQKSNDFTIDNIMFNLDQNKSIALIGPAGSGKTTIMNVLALRERCETFVVEEQGELMYPFLSNTKKASLEKRITTLDENPFVDFLTTNEQFQILKTVDYQKEYTDARYEALCTYFDFDKYVNYLVNDLSPENIQKRQIILTLASDNKYIFMDNPMAGLSPQTMQKFALFLQEEKTAGKKFIISAPNVDVLFTVPDYYMFLDNGAVREEGTASSLQKKYQIEINELLYQTIYQGERAA